MKTNKYFKKISMSFLLFILIFTLLNGNKMVYANPLPVSNTVEFGGLLPSNISLNLQMQQADVCMSINAENHPYSFEVDFYGTYIFYNPNETIELIIGAPFMIDYFYNGFNYIDNIDSNMQIFVNGIEVNHTYSYFQNLEGWEEYIENFQFYRIFAIANVSFLGQAFTNIEYSWHSNIETYDLMESLSFYYDVATGRAWSGNITEKVTMSIIGKQPDFYTDYQHGFLSKSCTIDKIPSGKNYTWIWENEEITDFYVGVEYKFDIYNTNYSITSILLGIVSFGITAYFIKKRKRKKRN